MRRPICSSTHAERQTARSHGGGCRRDHRPAARICAAPRSVRGGYASDYIEIDSRHLDAPGPSIRRRSVRDEATISRQPACACAAPAARAGAFRAPREECRPRPQRDRMPDYEQVAEDAVMTRMRRASCISRPTRTMHGRWCSVTATSMGGSIRRRSFETEDMDAITRCLTSVSRIRPMQGRDSSVQDDSFLDSIQRAASVLHVLFDYRARSRNHPEPFRRLVIR